jgi:hypothetical protein
MNPLLRSRQALGLYIAGWVMLGAFLALLLARLRDLPYPRALFVVGPLALVYGAICLSAYWVSRSRPFRGDQPATQFMSMLSASAQASAVWVALAAPWIALLSRFGALRLERPDLIAGFGTLFVLGVPLYMMSLALHYLLLTFERSREAERQALESQVATREAELRALRAQLNPHFLFNSLNSINALVGGDPEGARRMCESLGDFLRRTLALGAREAVTVAEELALVDRYLEIERVRFGARLAVERQVDPAAEACLVPPLLLQPLVENAVKHGIADRIDGGTLRLTATRRDGSLALEVENEADADAPGRPGEGVGLQNVKRRLHALAPRESRLDATLRDGRFKVTLILPARESHGA